jgi:Rrf2 family transcriptional regulator, cysteine metabolism repressor
MKISQKAEYAVRAALDLALHGQPNSGVRSLEVARRTGVPGKFLEAILLDLRKGGFVSSKRGPDGGHWLARDPSLITVGAVLEAIDGPLGATRRKTRRRATPADTCVEALWGRVEAAVHTIADTVTLDDLRRQVETRGGMDFTI